MYLEYYKKLSKLDEDKIQSDYEEYKIILNEQKLKPKECVFIDDKGKNLKSAEKIGIISIKYNIGMSVQDLRTRLIKEGYKIPKS